MKQSFNIRVFQHLVQLAQDFAEDRKNFGAEVRDWLKLISDVWLLFLFIYDIYTYILQDCDLTTYEIAAIAIYSAEMVGCENFYSIFNRLLRAENRSYVKPLKSYLYLMMSALSFCPESGTRTLYRGLKFNSQAEKNTFLTSYKQSQKKVWYV